MPETSVIVTILVGIFSAGVTWGIMSAKLKAVSTKIDTTITELQAAVAELKTLTTEVKVMSALSTRVEHQLNNHGEKISRLEADVAKLQARVA